MIYDDEVVRNAIEALVPGADYSITGDGGIDWRDHRPLPSDDEIEASIQNSGLSALATARRAHIVGARQAAEADGITHNGIRYSGDPANRQALREAVEAAEDAGMEAFNRWKDSDDQFHTDHPVADVWAALRAIAARRSQLIDREGDLVTQIDAALAAEDREALETIEWSEE